MFIEIKNRRTVASSCRANTSIKKAFAECVLCRPVFKTCSSGFRSAGQVCAVAQALAAAENPLIGTWAVAFSIPGTRQLW
jgi:hypothetical protein